MPDFIRISLWIRVADDIEKVWVNQLGKLTRFWRCSIHRLDELGVGFGRFEFVDQKLHRL